MLAVSARMLKLLSLRQGGSTASPSGSIPTILPNCVTTPREPVGTELNGQMMNNRIRTAAAMAPDLMSLACEFNCSTFILFSHAGRTPGILPSEHDEWL